MAFTPRLTDENMWNNTWWFSNGNPFYSAGYGLPNCTCYAYGRYAEIREGFAPLPTGNAGDWWPRAQGAFDVGQTPALGAIACFYDSTGTYSGHVGVVEEIYANGDFLLSNSGWISKSAVGTQLNFFTYLCTASNGYLGTGWMSRRNYTFQGFIYQDADPTPLPGMTDWHAKARDGYAYTSQEAYDNCLNIVNILLFWGWALPAICGLLGNIDAECSYNFWQWEGNRILSSTSDDLHNRSGPGYGFVQWTPSAEYVLDTEVQKRVGFGPNFSDSPGKLTDAQTQLWAIANRTIPQGQWIPRTGFNISFTDYKVTGNSPEWCAECFVRNYERPATDPNTGTLYFLARRKARARYWYDKFVNYSPGIPNEPESEETVPDVQPEKPVPGREYKAEWEAKNTGIYERTSEQAYNNAACIVNLLFYEYHWSACAICALLGNVEVESGYNPWHWDADNGQSSFVLEHYTTPAGLDRYSVVDNESLNEDYIRYGLLSWFPASFYLGSSDAQKLTKFQPNYWNYIWHIEFDVLGNEILYITGVEYTGDKNDGEAQIRFLAEYSATQKWASAWLEDVHEESEHTGYWYAEENVTPDSFEAFAKQRTGVQQLTKAFMINYCHKTDGDETLNRRIAAANYWYNIFGKLDRRQNKLIYYQKNGMRILR